MLNKDGSGILYVISVPIGNYGDITERAKAILEQVEYIASEDTRRSAILMKRMNIEIRNRLISNHKFNEYTKKRRFINDLVEGKNVAIITDAGTPCISDPGNELIREAIQNGIRVSPIPGCCAAIAALSVSGFDLRRFAFYGFFPRDNASRQKLMTQIVRDSSVNTIALYESPKRIIDAISFFVESEIECEICLCNDLTKYYEYIYRGKPKEVFEKLTSSGKAEKGEYVIVCELKRSRKNNKTKEAFSPEALLVETLVREGCELREAIQTVATDSSNNYSKNELYMASLRLKNIL